MRVAAIAFVLVVVGTACTNNTEISGDRRVVGGVNVTFTVTPARVELGRPVRFTLRLQNNTGRAERLTFPTGQEYEFTATQNGREVWKWSEDRVFTQAIMHRTLAPQDSITLTESWTPEDPGSYDVHGHLRAEGYERDLSGKLVVGG